MQPPDYDLNKIKFATDESTFRQLQNKETCFGWEEPLLELNSTQIQAK